MLLLDTSAAVALVVEDHEAHAATLEAVRGRSLGLAGHAWFETYSVLTRLPDGSDWIAPPVVTATPLAVFITVRRADTFDVPGCLGILGHEPWGLPFGPLPGVGGYLTGTPLVVHLTQPLGLRVPFDGSGLLPEPRLPIR